ncbi:glycosyltransferase 87 family protein [Actinopolyspora erythraea]|uniref:glycosyltransferase 87 family protein n=1 Tax=Actinopolyspora erythraea TaxID=414996 RepID=UPI0012FE6531|nr:glycosyltransferase 87 family protein [Actinopolyspora erythraea]
MIGTATVLFVVPSLLQWVFTGTLIIGDFLDVTVYQAGGIALLNGESLYQGGLPVGGGREFPFTYPPFAAAVFTPLSFIPQWACTALVIPVHLALLVTVVRKCLRLSDTSVLPANQTRRATAALTAILFLMEPITWTMWLGQINLVLLAVVLFDLTRSSRWAGIGTGLAAGLKLTPGLFMVYLLFVRRFYAAATAAAAAATTIGVGFVIAPDASTRYWSGVFLDNTRFEPTDSPANLSISGLLARLLGTGEPQRILWLLIAIVVAVVALALADKAHADGRVLLGLTVTGLATSAVSPFSWSHHWVWLAPLGIIAILGAPRMLLAPLAVLTFAWPMHIILGLNMGYPVLGISALPPWHGLELVYDNSYLICFLATLIAIWRTQHQHHAALQT